MNFLSHYYTELPNNNPLFVTGLLLPDLTPQFSKIYNKTIKNAPIPASDPLKNIHTGILAHYRGDKKFHNSEVFLHHQQLLTMSMVNEGLDRNRLRFSTLAHVGVELMIDRHIVIQHRDVCNDFYRCIDNATEDDLIAYYKLHGLEPANRIFLSNFHFFRERRFLFMLNDLNHVVFALNRILGRVLKIEFTDREKSLLHSALYNIDDIIRYRWQEILKA